VERIPLLEPTRLPNRASQAFWMERKMRCPLMTLWGAQDAPVDLGATLATPPNNVPFASHHPVPLSKVRVATRKTRANADTADVLTGS
jgi:hypothetical protein